MDPNKRPNLSAFNIIALLVLVIATAVALLSWPNMPAPGSPSGQLSAASGTLLLLIPILFLFMKRSGMSASPPTWFVAHVLATSLGCCLIFIHVAAADWITPPGLVLLALIFLILQGSVLRVVLARRFGLLFARSSSALGYHAPANLDRVALQELIDAKVRLLLTLDPTASEALFSPALQHWLRQPGNSFRYQLLAVREARLIGARSSAGAGLSWSRRVHLGTALAFYLGLLAHILVVLFFAGYAADGTVIDWWYITDWGGE